MCIRGLKTAKNRKKAAGGHLTSPGQPRPLPRKWVDTVFGDDWNAIKARRNAPQRYFSQSVPFIFVLKHSTSSVVYYTSRVQVCLDAGQLQSNSREIAQLIGTKDRYDRGLNHRIVLLYCIYLASSK